MKLIPARGWDLCTMYYLFTVVYFYEISWISRIHSCRSNVEVVVRVDLCVQYIALCLIGIQHVSQYMGHNQPDSSTFRWDIYKLSLNVNVYQYDGLVKQCNIWKIVWGFRIAKMESSWNLDEVSNWCINISVIR